MNNSRIIGVRDEEIKCPLMGAVKTVSMVKDAAMLVIGTEECTYYSKSMLSGKGEASKCFSFVLESQDVTFGSVDKVREACKELIAEEKFSSLFLITTCVVEIIGDDFTSLACELEEEYNIPVRVVRTNHFKGGCEKDGFKSAMKEASSFTKLPSKFEEMKMKMKMIKNKINSKQGEIR